jgi:UDP-2-acetamido-2-deoxy-ribo-hexuluronate aminotransferase
MPSTLIPFIDLRTQYKELKSHIQQRINAVLEHGQYIMGPEVRELEERLEVFTGSKHCITCASGTDALLISLMALGIGPDDEVITTPFTFAATVEVIVLLGAKPVFVDVDPETCNIDSALIEARISTRTRAIMPVSLYGQVADMDEINSIAARHGNIAVIEDAAQSFGSVYKKRKSGNLSTFGCTSFFPSKPLGCYGDGGALFTNDDDLALACREIRVHGQSRRYEHTRVGLGGRMDTLQCAVVLAKLERFEWEIARRLEISERYNELLDALGVARVQQRADSKSVYGQYTVFVENRDVVQKSLKDAGIPTAVHYPVPMNMQPAYAHLCCPGCTPHADKVAKRVMSLPMHPDLSSLEVNRIVSALAEAIKLESSI